MSNTPLNKEVEKILSKLFGTWVIEESDGESWGLSSTSISKTEAIKLLNDHYTQLLLEMLPQYRDNTNTEMPLPETDDFISAGYNQALTDVRNKIKELKETSDD